MTANLQDVRTSFDWQPQPAAAALVGRLLQRCIQSNPQIATLGRRMSEETGTRLVDWVEAVSVGDDEPGLAAELEAVGFVRDSDRATWWRHPAGIFPAINHHSRSDGHVLQLWLKVSSVDDFLQAQNEIAPLHWHCKIFGHEGSQWRRAYHLNTMAVIIEERHGCRAPEEPKNTSRQIAAAAKHRRSFAERRRTGQSDAELFAHATALFDAAAADLGRDWACDLFFAAERDYWMSRNAAARVQYARQQSLGLGWANHDHHTYRSSRESFASLIAFLENAGFELRERFYAGREAGWGAQVLEQPRAGIVIFADVDLTPDEVMGDFAHEPLQPLPKLGTVGLWCKLHGEAFLAAGMHHLECQFDFDAVREQLAAAGVETMTPFTHWAHLKQAFTTGEIWPVPFERIEAALAGGYITKEQAEQFRRDGALGSHLEILERNDGFKGFNQTGISEIISRTDPRKW